MATGSLQQREECLETIQSLVMTGGHINDSRSATRVCMFRPGAPGPAAAYSQRETNLPQRIEGSLDPWYAAPTVGMETGTTTQIHSRSRESVIATNVKADDHRNTVNLQSR